MSPSIARSRSVNQAPTSDRRRRRSRAARSARASRRRGRARRRAAPAPSRPGPGRRSSRLKSVGREDQEGDVGEVAPRLEAAAGDDVGGERQRADRLDRPGREPALAQRPRVPAPAARRVRAAPRARASRRGSRGRRRRAGRGSSGAAPGSSRSRSARSSRKASGASATSAAVASTAPSGKASALPRGSSPAPGRRRAGPRTPAGTTSRATAIPTGKPTQVICARARPGRRRCRRAARSGRAAAGRRRP